MQTSNAHHSGMLVARQPTRSRTSWTENGLEQECYQKALSLGVGDSWPLSRLFSAVLAVFGLSDFSQFSQFFFSVLSLKYRAFQKGFRKSVRKAEGRRPKGAVARRPSAFGLPDSVSGRLLKEKSALLRVPGRCIPPWYTPV